MEENPSSNEPAADGTTTVTKAHWWGAGAIIAALLIILLIIGVGAWKKKQKHDQDVQDFIAAMRGQGSHRLGGAVDKCGVRGLRGVSVGDGGQSLTMTVHNTVGIRVDDAACVLSQLKVPDYVVAAIDQTRALDGRQSESWDGLRASWTYHPDDGLRIVIVNESGR